MNVVLPTYQSEADDKAFTLIEVLASVIIISLFGLALMTLLSGFALQAQLDQEKQTALLLANAQMSDMAGGAAVYLSAHSAPIIETSNNIPYTLTLSDQTANEPTWAAGLVYAEVNVSWVTVIEGRQVTEHVTLTQAFAQ